MKFLVLLNPTAGSGKGARPGEFANSIRDGFGKRGIEAEVRLVNGSSIVDTARVFVNQHLRVKGGGVLVVGGGDGTVSSAASVVAGTDIILGVLALGTLNHFAKDMRLPIDLGDALDVIVAGQVRTVDVGEVSGHIFINNSSIGIYPFLVAERTVEQKRRGVGKLTAFGPALIRTIKGAFWQRVRISKEGAPRELRTPCVFVGNNFYDLAALGRRRDLSSGELCVYVVKQQTRLGLALLPLKVAFGMIDRARNIESFRAQHLEIGARRQKIQIAIDGEIREVATPLLYSTRPGSLHVLAPPTVATVQSS
jgi:diacylglycerol kinase family enzyme